MEGHAIRADGRYKDPADEASETYRVLPTCQKAADGMGSLPLPTRETVVNLLSRYQARSRSFRKLSGVASHRVNGVSPPPEPKADRERMITNILAALFFGTIIWRGVVWYIEHGPPHEPPDWWRPG